MVDRLETEINWGGKESCREAAHQAYQEEEMACLEVASPLGLEETASAEGKAYLLEVAARVGELADLADEGFLRSSWMEADLQGDLHTISDGLVDSVRQIYQGTGKAVGRRESQLLQPYRAVAA